MSWCASESGLLRTACLMGAELEGGSLTGPWAIGDNGLAVGPYQEHPSYGDTTTRESGASAWAAIRGDYQRCLGVGDNTASGVARIVQCAERPANAYPNDRIQNAWQIVSTTGSNIDPGAIVNGGTPFGIPNPLDGVGQLAGGIGQIGGAISGIAKLFATILDTITNPDFIISILLVFGGFWVAILGLFNLASKSSTVRTGAAAAAVA